MAQSEMKPDVTVPLITLPPHYAIRRYFREQDKKFQRLDDALGADNLQSWRQRYRKSPIRSDDLEELAKSFEDILIENGGFSVSRESIPQNKMFPHRESQNVSGFLLSPITLGEGWFEEGSKPYHENALLLRYAYAQFKIKKAVIALGACGFLFTQHALERVYERSESDQERFSGELHSEIFSAMKALALVNAGRLWVTGEKSVLTAIPFLNGLMIINHRVCVRGDISPEMGFRISLPGGTIQSPHINKSCLVDDKVIKSDDQIHFFIMPCATTYFNFTTLNEEQNDYLFLFKALLSEVGDDNLWALATINFAPDQVHERAPSDFKLLARHEKRRAQLLSALNAGWLKADKSQPVAGILPFGFETLNRHR